MHIVIRLEEKKNTTLQLGRTIFLRPTPWKIAFGMGKAFFTRSKTYQFVTIPPQYLSPAFEYFLEDGREVRIQKDNKKVFETPVEPLSIANAILYHVESFVYGFLLSVWHWRLNADTMTKKEMQAKIEELDAYIARLKQRQEHPDDD